MPASVRASVTAEAGACFPQRRRPGARDLSPSRGSAALGHLAPAAVLGQQSRVAKVCRGWEEDPAHVLSATLPVPPSARAQRTSMDAARRAAPARRPPRWRRVSALLTLTLLTAACTTAGGHSGTSAATGHTPPSPPGAPLSTSPGAPGSAPGPPVSISAVGDIIMGSTPQ